MGYLVKEARKAADMTQAELAEKSGVSRATIVAMENGVERNTSTKTLAAIASALNTTIDKIFFLD